MWLGTWTKGASAAATTLNASPTECPSRVMRKKRSVVRGQSQSRHFEIRLGGEELLGLGYAAQRVAADGNQPATRLRVQRLCKVRGYQNIALDRSAHCQDPADLVDGRTDDS